MNYVLHGQEQYMLNISLKSILKNHQIDEELNKVEYDARKVDVSVVLEDAQTYPFFTDHKAIIVYNANFLSANDDTKWDLTALEQYLKQPLESTILIFVCDHDKLDGRKKIVKSISSLCKVLKFQTIDETGKCSFIDEQIQKRGLQIPYEVKRLLYQRLPCDIFTIQTELDKVELYDEELTYDIANILVTRPMEDDVFQLVNAVVEHNKKKAFHVWKDLQVLNVEVIQLIGALASSFRFLYQVSHLMRKGKGKNEIVSILKAHPYRTQMAMKNANTLSVNFCLQILNRLADLDQQIKSGRVDKIVGFELFLLEM